MAAVVEIWELSASMAGTDKTSGTVRFKLADNQTVDGVNPMTIPSSSVGTRRSFTKQLRMYCATAPGNYIDNLRMYSDGANTFGTGITVNATNAGSTWAANATPALTGGSDLFEFRAATPMNIDSVHTASVTATGFFSDLVKLQMVVASTASSGILTAETLTFAYDEV